MKIRAATLADNDALCELCEHGMAGNIDLALERNPNFFAGSYVQCEEPEVFVCEAANLNVVGVFSIGSRRVWLHGAVKTIRYLSDLRLDEHTQRAKALFFICDFINKEGFLKGNLAQTIVFEGNAAMHRVIALLNERAKKHPSYQYFKQGVYVSTLLNLKNKAAFVKQQYRLSRATKLDIKRMNDFMEREARLRPFFPYYVIGENQTPYTNGLHLGDYYIAENEHEILGIGAVWDQGAFKQTRVKGYASLYKILRPFHNLWVYFMGGFSLPAAGEIMPYLNLHGVLIKNNDAAVFKALLNQILADYRSSPYSYLLCGMDENSLLMPAFNSYVSKRSIRGNHYLVSHEKPTSLLDQTFYLELSRI
ncbi:MAG: hypothetical protein SGJ00_07285 [bacterium]|nr:hypothetical protein [bacterium]